MQNNDFWRVSADTKTCGSPLNPSPTGVWRLPAGKHTSILTYLQTIVNKKNKKNKKNQRRGRGGFLATKRHKTHKRDKKMTKKVLFST